MRAVVQRVRNASVSVDGKVTGSIEYGLLIYLGVSDSDDERICERMADKISKLRIFRDSDDKMNLSVADVGSEIFVVSQFTLYANLKKGNRPSFIKAGSPEHAEKIYDHIVSSCREQAGPVKTGEFGADMKINLVNDGPFTIVLDSAEL